MAGILNSLKNALGGAAGPGGGGGADGGDNGAGVSAKAFASSAPSWADLGAMVAAQRAQLGVPEPDLENVSGWVECDGGGGRERGSGV